MALLAVHSIRSAFAMLAHVKCISWTSNVPNTHALTHTRTQYHTIALGVFTQVVRPTVPACCVYV